MKYLAATLLLMSGFAAAGLAADQAVKVPVKEAAPLTPVQLGAMLTDLALEPKDVSLKGAKDVYSIVSERDGRKININISLSTDRTALWFESKTVAMPDPNADLGDAWLRLLRHNADITPAYFSFNDKDRRIYLLMQNENAGITPAVLRTLIDRFDGYARSTAADWDPRNFRPVPIVPTLTAAERTLLAQLDGVWEEISEETKGKKSDDASVAAAAVAYTFAGGKVAMKSANGLDVEAQLWAAPGAGSMQLDFYFLKHRAIEKAIVKLDGDTLTICVAYHGVDRPKQFGTSADFSGALRVFKRKKAA